MLRAAVLNRYLNTWGGGERVTFALANQLSSRYVVDVLTDEATVPTRAQINTAFGPGYDGFKIRQFESEQAITNALPEYSLFINHCAGSSLINRSPMGLYFVMFPFQEPGEFLKSYDYFVCNSEFTRFYTELKWSKSTPTEVLYPGAEFPEQIEFSGKEKMILSVGRFNTGGHNKNQDLLIDAFKSMLPYLPSGWSLHLLGRVNEGRENQSHVANLIERCAGLPIEFHLNVDEPTKRQLLRRASVYWHGTGWNRTEPKDAHTFEHFGISVVEAMGHGCVPICYAGGGPLEIIEFGKSGWHFDTTEDLMLFTSLCATDPLRLRLAQSEARARAQHFSRAQFNHRLGAFLAQVAP